MHPPRPRKVAKKTIGTNIKQQNANQVNFWREHNRSAITAYNKSVTETGVFSDGIRGF